MMRLVLLIWSATLLLSSAVIGNEEGEEYEFEFDVAKILEESKTSHYCEDHWGYKARKKLLETLIANELRDGVIFLRPEFPAIERRSEITMPLH